MRPTPRRLLVGVALVSLQRALGRSVAVSLFLTAAATVVLVGHDTVVRPTLARDAVVETGPCCRTSGSATSGRWASP